MSGRTKNSTPSKKTLLIVTANEAEAAFFSQMRKDCRYTNLNVISSGAKSLKDIVTFSARERMKGRYDVTYALFGLDDLSCTLEEANEMKEACLTKRVRLCYFNPSFDLWIYLHLGQPKAYISDKGAIVSAVEKAIAGYSMDAEYLMTKGQNLYMQLFPRHAQADLNAREYNKIATAATGKPATLINELNATITEICGQADMSHNTKAFK